MSDEATARLGLPLLNAGQAQKEIAHNESLALIDLLVQPIVVARGQNSPPASPQAGQAWIVGSNPSGAWAGHGDAIAGWTDGGWRFVAPTEGFAAWCAAEALEARYSGGAWRSGEIAAAAIVVSGEQVVGARRPAIADPADGATVDSQARSALAAILGALRGHGLIAS